jgi:hypothetical protein
MMGWWNAMMTCKEKPSDMMFFGMASASVQVACQARRKSAYEADAHALRRIQARRSFVRHS